VPSPTRFAKSGRNEGRESRAQLSNLPLEGRSKFAERSDSELREGGQTSEHIPPPETGHAPLAGFDLPSRGRLRTLAVALCSMTFSRPTSTYRLQFRDGMTLEKAADLAPYFAALGISHLYASPLFAAVPGSTHGYDVVSFAEIDPAIGGSEGFNALAAALDRQGLGLILDFVPNHMGASPFNPWWRDVLEWGQESDYREHFDIDWAAPKLIVPALGEPYGEALQQGRFGLALDDRDGGITLTYHDLRLPLTPPSYGRILARIEAEPFPELARRFAAARPETATPAKEELATLARDAAVRPKLDEAIAAAVADHVALHDLHEAQVWRLSYWRAARERLTYRRFFEIADLVGMRVERPRVFDDVHALLKALIADGCVHGVRIDHIDGLADPRTYLDRLQETIGREEPSFLLVEKIRGPGEVLRPSWPVAGTTGYEFIEALAGLFVDPQNAPAMTEAYEAFLGRPVDYTAMVRETKRRILVRNLAGELEFLRDLAQAFAERDPSTRDYGADSLRRAIVESAAALPVYRTYVNVAGPDETDRAIIGAAADAVKASREVEDEGAVHFIARLLTLDLPDPETQAAALVFAARFQQTTGSVMAKALEDTVFYRYNRLIALNEVGGDPNRFGAPVEAFHRAMQARLAQQPFGLSATGTHDTKRGEDARARLYCISEMPGEWSAAVSGWSGMLEKHRGEIDGAAVPEAEIEWLFYQALAGAWPADLQVDDAAELAALTARMDAYIVKAVREAKLRTSWGVPARDYEKKVAHFVQAALSHQDFLKDFRRRCAPLFLAGAVNSLSQLAIKLAAPGVPDIYQSTELWDLSLVDPDNRRPIDFETRREVLDETGTAAPEALLEDWRSGRAKMRLLKAGLTFRRDHPRLFGEGEYLRLEIAGGAAEHLIAFARRHEEEWLFVAATRLPFRLLDGVDIPLVPPARWSDTRIIMPEGARDLSLRDIVFDQHIPAGRAIDASKVLSRFPVTILFGGARGAEASERGLSGQKVVKA
jgi:(1->4)-alpha-D-glucan 1-alpha-D-glucosylmutase